MKVDQFLGTISWPDMKKYRGVSVLFSRFWDTFYYEKVKHILTKGGTVVDISGGLRIDKSKSNIEHNAFKHEFTKLVNADTISFITTDYTDQYSPDQVEDIHALSFQDNSVDGIFCIAVLEHVYDPKKACEEMIRVLKPGGSAFIYVPFLYAYHGHDEDYHDYFRYSKDGLAYLFRGCTIELCPVRGALESLFYFVPMGRWSVIALCMRFLDWNISWLRSASLRQSSGYFACITKS